MIILESIHFNGSDYLSQSYFFNLIIFNILPAVSNMINIIQYRWNYVLIKYLYINNKHPLKYLGLKSQTDIWYITNE